MFVDRAKITVRGGDGGNACCSFRREKFIPKGGPDGGDGGNGGDIILRASKDEQSLAPFIFNRHYDGERGPNGKGKDQHGRNAPAVILPVPVGTVVTDTDSEEVLVDMDEPGMEFIVAHGGRGGRGNTRFATNTNRAPRMAEEGFPGEERHLELELKTIADVGLVGYPNAGKSTLLRAVSEARPKVAPYPFTTLHPVVGVVNFPDFTRMTIADIPGLIDGAHANVGLGHAFLKHIERTHVLVFVLDMAGTDNRTPYEDFRHLQRELELYMRGLSRRPAIIAANKMDCPESAENLELLREELKSDPIEIIPISAAHNELDGLVEKLRQMVEQHKISPYTYY